MKSYTDISQSKKLVEILPLESSDGYWDFQIDGYNLIADKLGYYKNDSEIPCWSLASLLGVLPKIINNETLFIETSAALWHVGYKNVYTARADNPVDACYELILKLNELKML